MTRPPVEIVAITVDKLVEVVAFVLLVGMIAVWVALTSVPVPA